MSMYKYIEKIRDPCNEKLRS